MEFNRTSLPRRAEKARDALVSYIHDQHLRRGDRLPTYAHLRSQFGFGSETIASAVSSLCALGVLEVRDKIGLFVVNPDSGHLVGRSIAVVVRPIAGSAYSATVASFLQKILAEYGCRCLTFYQCSAAGKVSTPGLEDFPGLEQALLERQCDGVITLCPFSGKLQRILERLHISCCFLGDDDHAPSSGLAVLIDVRRFLSDALAQLKKAGCRHIIQLCANQEQVASRSCSLPALIGASYDGGAEIARTLLALPASRRPDGIISDDDTIVSGFYSELLSNQLPEVSYLPWVATIIHAELGECYPSRRTVLFVQKIEDYARSAVRLLIDTIRHGASKQPLVYYRFTPAIIETNHSGSVKKTASAGRQEKKSASSAPLMRKRVLSGAGSNPRRKKDE